MENVVIDPEELEEAEQMAEEAKDKLSYTHAFKKPVTFEEKTYEKLHFDWGKLTGKDGVAIEEELQAAGIALVIPSLSGPYLMRMASRASEEKVCSDFFASLPLRDYNRIRSEARSFLLKTE